MIKRKPVYPVPMYILTPTVTTVKGVKKKTYPDTGSLFFGSFQTFGGTEKVVNDTYLIEDTAIIETWYNPDIKSDCRILLEDGSVYELINSPENIELRNITMRFKIRRLDTNV